MIFGSFLPDLRHFCRFCGIGHKNRKSCYTAAYQSGKEYHSNVQVNEIGSITCAKQGGAGKLRYKGDFGAVDTDGSKNEIGRKRMKTSGVSQKKILWVRMVVVLMIVLMVTILFSIPTYAASDSGIIGGTNVYASLTRTQTGATAATTSNSSSMIHTASVTVWYYYTAGNQVKQATASGNSSYHASVIASAAGQGENVATYGAISTHGVYYGNYSWTTTLRDPSGFTG